MMIGYVKEIVRDLNCIYLQNILMNSFLIFFGDNFDLGNFGSIL